MARRTASSSTRPSTAHHRSAAARVVSMDASVRPPSPRRARPAIIRSTSGSSDLGDGLAPCSRREGRPSKRPSRTACKPLLAAVDRVLARACASWWFGAKSASTTLPPLRNPGIPPSGVLDRVTCTDSSRRERRRPDALCGGGSGLARRAERNSLFERRDAAGRLLPLACPAPAFGRAGREDAAGAPYGCRRVE